MYRPIQVKFNFLGSARRGKKNFAKFLIKKKKNYEFVLQDID